MDYSAVYKRPGGALKLVSWGDGDNNVNEKVWGVEITIVLLFAMLMGIYLLGCLAAVLFITKI